MKDKKPNLLKLFSRAVLVGTIITATSFFINLVPCKIPNTTRDSLKFSLCRLPNPLQNLSDLTTQFYGFSNNPLTGLSLQFLIPFVIFLLIFLSLRKKTGRILDLTKK